MHMGDAISTTGDLVRRLPTRPRARVEITAATAFLLLALIGRADDLFVWLWRVFTDMVTGQLGEVLRL